MPTCVMSLLREPRSAAGSRGDEGTANAEHAELQVTMTTQPTNESELQLYRVLQHANLLSYYDIFISQGGDDVQQLCEAGEDEFLEIMALVGMASKPLHVRRLQKALQEWVSAPGKFHLPMVPVPTVPAAAAAGFLPVRPLVGQSPAPLPVSLAVATTAPAPTRTPPQPTASSARSTPPSADSPTPSLPRDRDPEGLPSPGQSQNSGEVWPPRPAGEDSGEQQYPQSGSPLQLTPTLRQSQIRRLAEAALHIAKTLPDFEPRQQHSSKRKACKELEYVLSMDPDDPKRLEKTRQYAAIYGRFDCKRKAEKPLTLHEVSVNEAAAQICLHVPALLTRRDELFPLARQVVRNSGYQYSKGHSRSQGAQGFSPRELRMPDDLGGGKRLCVDPADSPPDPAWRARQERLEQVTEELRQLQERGEELQRLQEQEPGAAVRQQMDSVESQQRQLLSEQRDLVQENKQSYKACLEFYDEDSQYSLGSAPSPPGQCNELPRAGSAFGDNADRVPGRITNKVIASAAGTIIAVANPALSMSQLPATSTAALLKNDPEHRIKQEAPPSPPQNGRPPAD